VRDPRAVLSALEQELAAWLPRTKPSPEVEKAWSELGVLQVRERFWDKDTPSPYDLWGACEAVAACGKGALRVVVPALESRDDDDREHALHILGRLGARARPALPRVIGLLEKTGDDRERSQAARAACAIDLELVRALGLDRDPRTRLAVMEWLVSARPIAERRAQIERLLDGDVGQQRFALLGGGPSLGFRGLVHHPDLIPVERVRALLSASDPEVVAGAQRALLQAGIGVGPPRVAPRSLYELEMIAPLASSDGIVDALAERRAAVMLAELARRRRHAGIPLPVARLRGFLVRELAARAHGTGRDVGDALLLLAELAGCEELRAEAAAAAREHPEWSSDPAMGEGAKRYKLAIHEERTFLWFDYADRLFEDGDVFTMYGGADAVYDQILLEHPGNPHAAFQLAWIARGFGVEIEPRRAAWIAELGFRDGELLAELLRPVPALRRAHMMGWTTVSSRGDAGKAAARAAQAERAELWGLAALQLFEGPAERRAALRRRAAAHLARVRAACPGVRYGAP
jgi:hypothetical protein